MFLRRKIFRHLVLFALIPSFIITALSYYFLLQVVDQAAASLASTEPERTINSLRVLESRLQDAAAAYLAVMPIPQPRPSPPTATSSRVTTDRLSRAEEMGAVLDWVMIIHNDNDTALLIPDNIPVTALNLRSMKITPGPLREVIDRTLILGSVSEREGMIVAGGYVLDYEYVSGFQAASAALKERRRFQTIRPGLMLFAIIAGGLALTAIIFIAYFLSRRISSTITTPLERLTTATSAITTGTMPQPITVTGTEEIARLTEAFNRMVSDLETSRGQLAAAERVAAWQEFARRMAHELKNPLTPISLSLYRIKKTLITDGRYDKVAESIEVISSELARLERMATEYSSLAQLPSPTMRTVDLTELLKKLLHLHQEQLEPFALTTRIPDEAITFTGDPDHIYQVLVNLMKNALEFTFPGGRINVTARADERAVIFEIANECHDVDEADLKVAKMPYVTTRKGGTGLGLAVSEKIIIDHGGCLTLGRQDGMTIARCEIPRHRNA